MNDLLRLSCVLILIACCGFHGEKPSHSDMTSWSSITPVSFPTDAGSDDPQPPALTGVPAGFRGLIVRPDEVTADSLRMWKAAGWHAIGLSIGSDGGVNSRVEASSVAALSVAEAARAIIDSGLELDWFLEVGRSPELADAHPEWMASLQVHDEWRRLYPDFPPIAEGDVVMTWPWVTVQNRESFDAQLDRIVNLLDGLPTPTRIWLNDLQGAPSACGCGHPLCRWTSDYGPIKYATALGDDASAKFVQAVRNKAGHSEVIPIWTTECEAHDKIGACGGVGCFDGICWKAWTKQLLPLAATCPTIGVSCWYKAHERDLPHYGIKAGWLKYAISAFESIPATKRSTGISAERLVAVLQGWDVGPDEISAQQAIASNSSTRGILLVTVPIDQSWKPRVYTTKSK